MVARKQSVSFTEAAFAFATELVERGEYPNVSAAVSGELARAKAAREREAKLLEAEVARRLALPPDRWAPVGDLHEVTRGARERLTALARERDRRSGEHADSAKG